MDEGNNPLQWERIKVVQNLIERCLQQYMTQTEITTALKTQANIEPHFTCLVWKKLEEQNPAFFHGYSVRLKLRDQIIAFNYLVDQQIRLMSAPGGTAANPSLHAAAEQASAAGSTVSAAAAPTAMAAPNTSATVQDISHDLMSAPLMSPTFH